MQSQSAQLETFETSCRNLGLKITRQRVEVFHELLKAADHPTADMLHRRLGERLPMISLDTVYRTLSTLAQYGLVNRIETPESLARFEVSQVRHHHLICRTCGEIRDFIWHDIDEAVLPEEALAWGSPERRSMVVYGVCRKCLKDQD